MSKSVFQIRNEYLKSSLNKKDLDEDPIRQFQFWLDNAFKSEVKEPTAMALSTVNDNGQPSSRIVLLKNISEGEFVFFTNYTSRKGVELTLNNKAALLFFWPELERQVRIEGTVSKTAKDISDEYFQERPLRSRLAAVASPQSREIPDRKFLEDKFNALDKAGQNKIDRPDFWGGYKLLPGYFEFWQGRESRLHDRFLYRKVEGDWQLSRMAP